MTKITELIPGQVWEDKFGNKREIVALGPETIVTRYVTQDPKDRPDPYLWTDTKEALWHLVRLHRPRQTKWLCLYNRDDGTTKLHPGLTLWADKEEAQFNARVQGWDLVAIVPVEFTPGDNLPQ